MDDVDYLNVSIPVTRVDIVDARSVPLVTHLTFFQMLANCSV